MNKNDMGIFLLCLFVFIALCLITGYVIYKDIKDSTKEIKSGSVDNLIEDEYLTELKKSQGKKSHHILGNVLDILFDFILVLLIATVLYFNFTGNNKIGAIPQIKVVESGSMSYKHENNQYLIENDLNNQFQVDDLILVYRLPEIDDIKKYDVILYESNNGLLIIHRVIDIKIDNLGHKTFVLRGDANPVSDPEVEYGQMLGIYHSGRVGFIGNFIRFLKSPAGYLILGLFIVVIIFYPSLENKLDKLKKERLLKMGYDLKPTDLNKKIIKKEEKPQDDPDELEPLKIDKKK